MVIFQTLFIVIANDMRRQSTRLNVSITHQNFDLPPHPLDYTRIYISLHVF
jgi:hypothetical protein